jgi:hypothetical protein
MAQPFSFEQGVLVCFLPILSLFEFDLPFFFFVLDEQEASQISHDDLQRILEFVSTLLATERTCSHVARFMRPILPVLYSTLTSAQVRPIHGDSSHYRLYDYYYLFILFSCNKSDYY